MHTQGLQDTMASITLSSWESQGWGWDQEEGRGQGGWGGYSAQVGAFSRLKLLEKYFFGEKKTSSGIAG